MPRSKVDPIHIQQYVFDEEKEAYRVDLLPTELSIELDAADGDNVLTKNESIIVDEANNAVSCIGMKTVCLYGTGVVSVSPVDSGDEFYNLSISELVPKEICARRIKIVGSGKLVVQGV